jgi:hypothetical protein
MAWQSYPWWEQPEGERQYRTFDPERLLEIKDEGIVGFTGLTTMRITGPDLNFTFYTRGRKDPERPKVVIRHVDTGGRLDHPDLQWIRPLIVEALEAYGSLYGFRRPGVTFETEILGFNGEVNPACGIS